MDNEAPRRKRTGYSKDHNKGDNSSEEENLLEIKLKQKGWGYMRLRVKGFTDEFP